MDYRNELKYLVTAPQIALLQNRVSHLMQLDSHAGEAGIYNIRSLYFDDCFDTYMLENEMGTDPREKFRIPKAVLSPYQGTVPGADAGTAFAS